MASVIDISIRYFGSVLYELILFVFVFYVLVLIHLFSCYSLAKSVVERTTAGSSVEQYVPVVSTVLCSCNWNRVNFIG